MLTDEITWRFSAFTDLWRIIGFLLTHSNKTLRYLWVSTSLETFRRTSVLMSRFYLVGVKTCWTLCARWLHVGVPHQPKAARSHKATSCERTNCHVQDTDCIRRRTSIMMVQPLLKASNNSLKLNWPGKSKLKRVFSSADVWLEIPEDNGYLCFIKCHHQGASLFGVLLCHPSFYTVNGSTTWIIPS